jgi:glutathione S-transferase
MICYLCVARQLLVLDASADAEGPYLAGPELSLADATVTAV